MRNLQKIIFSVFIISLTSSGLQAQETIITDRPNQTDAATLISPGMLQFEVGYVQGIQEFNNGTRITDIGAPTVAVKYGLSNRVELRVLSGYGIVKRKVNNETQQNDGMGALVISPKFSICDQQDIRPKMTIATGFRLPYTGGSFYRSEDLDVSITGIFEYALGKLTWTSSLGTSIPTSYALSYTSTVGYPLTDRLGIFGESYGFINKEATNQHLLDVGLTYLINNHFQLDVIYGKEFNQPGRYNFFGFGFAWNTNLKD